MSWAILAALAAVYTGTFIIFLTSAGWMTRDYEILRNENRALMEDKIRLANDIIDLSRKSSEAMDKAVELIVENAELDKRNQELKASLHEAQVLIARFRERMPKFVARGVAVTGEEAEAS